MSRNEKSVCARSSTVTTKENCNKSMKQEKPQVTENKNAND